MIVLRVYRGVREHFPIRVTEWLMLWPTAAIFLALQADGEMFTRSPSFVYLANWADEHTWAAVVGIVAVFRLAALTINGTFKGFAFSPHIRAGASVVGAIMWWQITLGFFAAFASAGAPSFGFILASTLVLAEVVNTYRSFSDIGTHLRGEG